MRVHRRVVAMLAATTAFGTVAGGAFAQGPGATDNAIAPLTGASSWFGAWAQETWFGVAIWQFLAAFFSLLAGLVAMKVLAYVFEKRVIPYLKTTRFSFDHMFAQAVYRPLGMLAALAGATAAAFFLSMDAAARVHEIIFGVLKTLVAADILWFVFRLIDMLSDYLAKLAERTESKLDDQLVPLLRKALKVTVAIFCVVWVVSLLGFNVGSLLAGLGIGGLAVALALQDTLGNFFGSIFIFADRPFIVGDRVRIGDTEGIVEEIGFRTTRIRTYPKTLLSMPNKTVANEAIDNLSKIPGRRVFQTVGVTYETSAEQMEKAVAALREAIPKDPGVDPETVLVRFDDFGDSSLNILVIYFSREVDFALHAQVKERVNLAIMRVIAGLGLSIAFPTRTVYFEGDIARRMAGGAKGAS